ncbi:nucleotidyltransferase family protein [Dinghuibacter silviterrae]|uniref:Nucleotidyltransferase-like protein n=1 Tax=Dinghuibacter silviterrae TaxID=1539049 RepID=A0A4R8DS74_9BACT|nr:sugar phosphate nucleotidyltransferase [Dinghuibacter silviterrae]TDX00001.1 nucleotidyltransferase-like protein [Dinghuibacter silviterrae]
MPLQRAIIFAAGQGPHLKPWTDQHPKALAQVNGKSLLQRNIEYLQRYGIKDVIVNVHHFSDQVIGEIERSKGWGSQVTISDETGGLLRTGGGLKHAAWYFGDTDPFVVMNVDMLTNLDLDKMLAFHQSHGSKVTMAVTKRLTSRNFLFNDQGRLCGWINTQTGEQRMCRADHPLIPKAYSCINIFQPSVFPLITKTGAFSIIDLYIEVAKHALVLGYDHTGDQLVDIGRPESIAKAEMYFQ